MQVADLDGFHVAWRRLDSWLATNSPDDRATLQSPATEEQIAAVEAAYGFPLHPQLRALLRLHNGTHEVRTSFEPGQFLPGRHQLASAEWMIGRRSNLVDMGGEWLEMFPERREDFDAEPLEAHMDHWVPFAFPNDGGMVFIDHQQGPTYGQVYEAGLGSGGEPGLWAADLASLFDQVAAALEQNGNFLIYTPTMCEIEPPTRFVEW